MTVMSSVAIAAPSLAVSRNPYVPPVENDAVVFVTLALPNVTVPGPLSFDHVAVNVPLGNPSSPTEPASVTEFVGSVIVWSGPAFAVGVTLAMMMTSSVVDATPSFAVSRNVYVPPTENDAVV